MDASQVDRFVGGKWDDEIVPQLVEYIRIPNKSPMFDADWVKHGYMEDAVTLMTDWARKQVAGTRLGVQPLDVARLGHGQRRVDEHLDEFALAEQRPRHAALGAERRDEADQHDQAGLRH